MSTPDPLSRRMTATRLPLQSHVLLAFLLAFLGGCATARPAASDYNALFASGRYSEAYEASAKVAGTMHAINHDQAALIAGLSARALDRNEDAKRWLGPLTSNADASIAGRAAAGMGSISQDEHHYQVALEYFTRAGSRLSGDDAAKALMYAGDCLRYLHRSAEATAMYTQAKARVASDQSLRIEIGDRLNGSGPAAPATTGGSPSTAKGKFTVQAGAFSTLKRANSEAKQLSSKGPTRTVPIKDHSGRSLYAVQVGRFQTKQDAEQLRRVLGPSAVVAEVVD